MYGRGLDEYAVEFWSSHGYANYNEAKRKNGVVRGETCNGYTAYADAMSNVKTAIEYMTPEAVQHMVVHLTVAGAFIGDFRLTECY
jgi:hypothetical protein